MTINEIYLSARKDNHYSLVLLIEFLLHEKKVLKETDNEEKLVYFLQDKFKIKMNKYLAEYEERRATNGG